MKLYFTLCILILETFFSSFSQAQTSMTQEEENMVKYWYYRNRLQYFMVQGAGIGEGQGRCFRILQINYSAVISIVDNKVSSCRT